MKIKKFDKMVVNFCFLLVFLFLVAIDTKFFIYGIFLCLVIYCINLSLSYKKNRQ
jgi:hypothetical protein